MVRKKKIYEEGSLLHFADIGFSNIKKLSKSALISEKLLGLNVLLFVIIMSINISFWLEKTADTFSLEFMVIFLVSIIFALILSLIYSPFLKIVANFSANKVDSLRVALMILFINLPLSVAGLIYHVNILIKISIGLIFFQVVLILFGSFIKYSKIPSQDVKVEPTDIWKVINKVSIICGILSFIITIILIFLK